MDDKTSKGVSVVIYVEPRAGLCNRMRVIESAYNLSIKYNSRVTVLWRVSKGLNCSYYDLFCKNNRIQVIETKFKFSFRFLVNALKCKKIFLNAKDEERSEIEKQLEGDNNKDIYINTVFPFHDIKNYVEFEPAQDIKEKISNICEKNFRTNTIGIHIRRTDNVNEIKYSPLDLFEKFIAKEIQKDKDVRFYLSTDSVDIENKITNMFGLYIIVNSNKTW